MEMKTSQETLVELYNEQLGLVLNRRAGVRMLQKMVEKDSGKVLTREFDPMTAQMKETTVKDRLETFLEALELEEMRLEEYQLMMQDLKEKGSTKHNTGVE